MSLSHRAAPLRAAGTVATLAYPLAVHAAVSLDRPELGLGVLAAVSALLCLLALARRGFGAATAGGVLLLFALAGLMAGEHGALYLPPVAILLSLLVLFARSLLPGQEPVITRIARLLGDEGPEVAAYTRKVTGVWVLFFGALLAESVLLALLAPLALWSLFTNVLNYLFTALLFVGEYAVRRRVLRHRRTAGWGELRRADWGALLRQ